MPTLSRLSTTDMEVTSIRLEKELKERLKAIAGNRGYQALIREVLWTYLEQQSGEAGGTLNRSEIRATIPATAERSEYCALTGAAIAPQATIRPINSLTNKLLTALRPPPISQPKAIATAQTPQLSGTHRHARTTCFRMASHCAVPSTVPT